MSGEKMEIEINISGTMDDESDWNDEYEHRIVRIPKTYRELNNLEIGEFLRFRNRQGGITTLQIAEAFKEDVRMNQNSSYVTTEVYSKLSVPGKEKNKIDRVTNITLGCDPETFLVDRVTGNVIWAYHYMKKQGDVGNDGALLEFRPNPSIYAEEVCDNLWTLIQKARRMLTHRPGANRIVMVGFSGYKGLSTGFHLHYGMPLGLLSGRPYSKAMANAMTKVFDYYVGIPSILPEGNKDVYRRTKQYMAYGKPGQWRLDHRTFEYRMPGGANLKHPLLARGLLALGAVVAEDVASRLNTCTSLFRDVRGILSDGDIRELYPNIPGANTFYSIVCNPEITAARKHFETVKSDVRKMVGYKQRAVAVESYFDCLDKDVQFGYNIEQNWGDFYNEKQQGKMVVL